MKTNNKAYQNTGFMEKNFKILVNITNLEPNVGFEPTTYGLQNRCSTN